MKPLMLPKQYNVYLRYLFSDIGTHGLTKGDIAMMNKYRQAGLDWVYTDPMQVKPGNDEKEKAIWNRYRVLYPAWLKRYQQRVENMEVAHKKATMLVCSFGLGLVSTIIVLLMVFSALHTAGIGLDFA